ncbi:MAG: nucleotidyltransferase domain-containing protein [Anaerolineae bacterium]|nr:MAG: nucleotidyltransferase domain-containing protein [Anaerolineae bacterium]
MIPMSEIRALAERIAEKFRPEKIILFGSYAYGTPTPDSDVDLLVIMPFEGRNPHMATEIWMATRPRFPVDLMVRKPSEVRERLALGDCFLREV